MLNLKYTHAFFIGSFLYTTCLIAMENSIIDLTDSAENLAIEIMLKEIIPLQHQIKKIENQIDTAVITEYEQFFRNIENDQLTDKEICECQKKTSTRILYIKIIDNNYTEARKNLTVAENKLLKAKLTGEPIDFDEINNTI